MRLLALALIACALPAWAQNTAPLPAPAQPTPPAISQPAPPAPPRLREESNKPSPSAFDRRDYSRNSPLAGDFTQFTEGKIALLRAELKPTPAQEKVFADFTSALRLYSETQKAHRTMLGEQRDAMQKDGQLSLPTQLGLRVAGLEEQTQNLKPLQLALANLYATLDDAQKKTADALLGFLAR